MLATIMLFCGCSVSRTDNELYSGYFCSEHRDMLWSPDLSTRQIADIIYDDIQKKYPIPEVDDGMD